jgi:peptide chain release factor 1
MSEIHKKYLEEYALVTQKLADPQITGDFKVIKELSQRHRELEEIKNLIEAIETSQKALLENERMEQELSEEEKLVMMAMIEEERNQLNQKIKKQKQRFLYLTIPRDEDDAKNILLEIRAGAGGDEAGIFAKELFRMYSRYAERQNFTVKILHVNNNDLGGIKELIAEINGAWIYGQLKHESGVHRVQRIPETEKCGRIHTSTSTVAIIPQAEEKELEIKDEEVKIDTYRSSGPGGQSVNTTDSAIRLTHLPTGVVVTCQDEKSQHKNKAKAFTILRSRLLQKKKEDDQSKMAHIRSSQIGTGDRSEKIRTYNFPQDRVTDHRIKKSWHGIEKIMEGEIESILKDLKQVETELFLKKQAE